MPQKQISPWVDMTANLAEYLLLSLSVEVDKYIAAKGDVELVVKRIAVVHEVELVKADLSS
jgi:hypothetical protein